MIAPAQFRFTPKQSRVYNTLMTRHPPYCLMHGGARSGKSVVFARSLFALATLYPNNFKAIVIRKRLKAARETIFKDTLRPIAKSLKGWTIRSENQSPVIEGPKGQIIMIAGMDQMDDILGDEYVIAWINEGRQVSYSDHIALEDRMARVVKSEDGEVLPPMRWMDTNPSFRHHWIHRLCLESIEPEDGRALEASERWYTKHWTPEDNPHLSVGFIERLKRLPEIRRRRMYSGDWCNNEGAVYDIFQEDIHTWAWGEEPAGWESAPTVEGIDFGYNDPFVWLRAKLIDRVQWFYPPFIYKSGVIVEEHAKMIKRHRAGIEPMWVVADHAAGDRATLNERHGIETIPAYKPIVEGVGVTKELLRPDDLGAVRMMVHEDMEEVLNEFFSYVWEPPREGRKAKEVPRDLDNHAMDTMRYMSMEVEGIRAGDAKASKTDPFFWGAI